MDDETGNADPLLYDKLEPAPGSKMTEKASGNLYSRKVALKYLKLNPGQLQTIGGIMSFERAYVSYRLTVQYWEKDEDCKKDFEKVKNLDLEFGTLIFNPETHDIMCSSRPNSNHEDTHAIKLEEGMVKHYLQNMDYGDYLEAKFQNELKKSRGGNNELL